MKTFLERNFWVISWIADILQIVGSKELIAAGIAWLIAALTGKVLFAALILVASIAIVVVGAFVYRSRPGDRLFERSTVPLSEAAAIVYGRMRRMPNSISAHQAEVWRLDPNKVLNFFALHVIQHATIFGKVPPSPYLEEIPASEFPKGQFRGGATTFNYYGDNMPRYVDLRIQKKRITEVVKAMAQAEEGFSAWLEEIQADHAPGPGELPNPHQPA